MRVVWPGCAEAEAPNEFPTTSARITDSFTSKPFRRTSDEDCGRNLFAPFAARCSALARSVELLRRRFACAVHVYQRGLRRSERWRRRSDAHRRRSRTNRSSRTWRAGRCCWRRRAITLELCKHVARRRSSGAHAVGLAIAAQDQLNGSRIHRDCQALCLFWSYGKCHRRGVDRLAGLISLDLGTHRQHQHVRHEELCDLPPATRALLDRHQYVDPAVWEKKPADAGDIVDSHRHRALPRGNLQLEAGPCADRRKAPRNDRFPVEDGDARDASRYRIGHRESSDRNHLHRELDRFQREGIDHHSLGKVLARDYYRPGNYFTSLAVRGKKLVGTERRCSSNQQRSPENQLVTSAHSPAPSVPVVIPPSLSPETRSRQANSSPGSQPAQIAPKAIAIPYGSVDRRDNGPVGERSDGEPAAMPSVSAVSLRPRDFIIHTSASTAPAIAPTIAPSTAPIGPSQAAAAANSFTSPAPTHPKA